MKLNFLLLFLNYITYFSGGYSVYALWHPIITSKIFVAGALLFSSAIFLFFKIILIYLCPNSCMMLNGVSKSHRQFTSFSLSPVKTPPTQTSLFSYRLQTISPTAVRSDTFLICLLLREESKKHSNLKTKNASVAAMLLNCEIHFRNRGVRLITRCF